MVGTCALPSSMVSFSGPDCVPFAGSVVFRSSVVREGLTIQAYGGAVGFFRVVSEKVDKGWLCATKAPGVQDQRMFGLGDELQKSIYVSFLVVLLCTLAPNASKLLTKNHKAYNKARDVVVGYKPMSSRTVPARRVPLASLCWIETRSGEQMMDCIDAKNGRFQVAYGLSILTL